MGLPSHQHQNPNTIPSHQHRIQVPSHPISTRLPLPSHPIYTRRRLPSHPINAFLRVSHPIPSHQCISSCFPSHRITIIKESDSHPIFVMVKLKKIPACGGLSDGIPSHVVPSAPRIALIFSVAICAPPRGCNKQHMHVFQTFRSFPNFERLKFGKFGNFSTLSSCFIRSRMAFKILSKCPLHTIILVVGVEKERRHIKKWSMVMQRLHPLLRELP